MWTPEKTAQLSQLVKLGASWDTIAAEMPELTLRALKIRAYWLGLDVGSEERGIPVSKELLKAGKAVAKDTNEAGVGGGHEEAKVPKARAWTSEETGRLSQLYQADLPWIAIAAEMPSRTVKGLRDRAHRLGLTARAGKWNEASTTRRRLRPTEPRRLRRYIPEEDLQLGYLEGGRFTLGHHWE